METSTEASSQPLKLGPEMAVASSGVRKSPTQFHLAAHRRKLDRIAGAINLPILDDWMTMLLAASYIDDPKTDPNPY